MADAIITLKNVEGLDPRILRDVQFSMFCGWSSLRAAILKAHKIAPGEWEFTNSKGVTFNARKESMMAPSEKEYYNSPECKFVSLLELMSYKPVWAND